MKVLVAQSCPTLKWPYGLQPTRLLCPWNSLGENTEEGCHFLLQGIFLTQGLNPGLPYCRQILYQLSHQGSPRILEWVAYAFSSGASRPRNLTGVSCSAGRFFTSWTTREVSWVHYALFSIRRPSQISSTCPSSKCACIPLVLAQLIKSLPAMQESWVWSLSQEYPLEKEMATHSIILAWKIPWTEEPGGLQSMGSQRAGHDWATNTLELSTCYTLGTSGDRDRVAGLEVSFST